MDRILLELNEIIETNSEKITYIYGFVKSFVPERITPSSLQEKTKEITTLKNQLNQDVYMEDH
jgi:uncharacterized protein YfkK (UPF0435 family)